MNIPLSSFSDPNKVLTPGKYNIYILNPLPKDTFDQVPVYPDLLIPIPLTDYDVVIDSWRYVSSLDQIVFSVTIKATPVSKYQESGVEIGYLVAGLSALAGIGIVALVFVKGEEILYIPSVAVIAAVVFYFYKDLKGLFN